MVVPGQDYSLMVTVVASLLMLQAFSPYATAIKPSIPQSVFHEFRTSQASWWAQGGSVLSLPTKYQSHPARGSHALA